MNDDARNHEREDCSDINFHQSPIGNGVVPCGRTDGQTDGGWTDITKPIVAFGNSANASIEWQKLCILFQFTIFFVCVCVCVCVCHYRISVFPTTDLAFFLI
jgi:hypothetical protein